MQAFDTLCWLDVACAKARCGVWLGGIMPEFVPWQDVFHNRSGAARRKLADSSTPTQDGSSTSSSSNTYSSSSSGNSSNSAVSSTTGDGTDHTGGVSSNSSMEHSEASSSNSSSSSNTSSSSRKQRTTDAAKDGSSSSLVAVKLRQLRHPLLMATYLKQKAELQRQVQLQPGLSSNGVIKSRQLGTRWEVMMRCVLQPTLLPWFHPVRQNHCCKRKHTVCDLPSSCSYLLIRCLVSAHRRQGLDLPAATSDTQTSDLNPSSPAEQLAAFKPPQPIDVIIPHHTSVVVITGPNTGGKTAAMKALGLAVAMAKVGMPIPAAAPALLPCYSSVLADIGDEQSLSANLSTFSGHLKRYGLQLA